MEILQLINFWLGGAAGQDECYKHAVHARGAKPAHLGARPHS